MVVERQVDELGVCGFECLYSAAYLHGKRLLYLRFHSGDIYRYFDFPPDQYDEFVAADSKGEYFAYNIRDKFRYEQVREAQTFTTGSR